MWKQIICHFGIAALFVLLVSSFVHAQTEMIHDADGDGMADEKDTQPLIAYLYDFTWTIGEMVLTWDVDQKVLLHLQQKHQEKHVLQTRFDLSGGAEIRASGEAKAEDQNSTSTEFYSDNKVTASLNPFKALSETYTSAGLQHKVTAQHAVRLQATLGDAMWGKDKVAWSRSASHAVEALRVQTSETELKNLHWEVTVTFFNNTDKDFVCDGLRVPIMSGSQSLADATPNKGDRFLVRRGRPGGVVVKFTATVGTIEALKALGRPEPPRFALLQTDGAIYPRAGS